LTNRKDLREVNFFTIDGETARDFDDAVAISRSPRGNLKLWVSIADVSHYVKEASALDEEAFRRGTSVYFPERALPMLPPRLSTGICSLNPRRPALHDRCYGYRWRSDQANDFPSVILANGLIRR
jgi:ribonuclease R